MLGKIAVMNSVALRTGKKNGSLSELQPQIAVILEIQECPKSHDRTLRQTCAKRIRSGIQLEQHRHGYRYEKCEEKILQPVLSRPRQCVEFWVQVMHLVVLPQERARVEAAVIPIEEHVAHKAGEHHRGGDGCQRFSIANAKVHQAKIQPK